MTNLTDQTEEIKLSAEDVHEILHRTCSAQRLAEQVTISCIRDCGGVVKSRSSDEEGSLTQVCETMQEWAAVRATAAEMDWPDPSNKLRIPYEVGVVLGSECPCAECRERGFKGLHRCNEAVQQLTWLFLDADKGQSAAQLRAALDQLDVCYLFTESSTSRSGGNPFKWHLILPYAEPVVLPSRSRPDVDGPASLLATEKWYTSTYNFLANALFTLGGIARPDVSVAKLSQPAFIAHIPPGGESRRNTYRGGRLFNFEKFLRLAGKEYSPQLVYRDADADDVTTKRSGGSRGDNGPVPTFDAPTTPGRTEGETTGSLLYAAFDYFDMIKERRPDGSCSVVCPWAENHHSTGRTDVVIFTKGPRSTAPTSVQLDGGFECLHDGGNLPGQCMNATAADVLRWARKHGCAALKDRPEFGGEAPAKVAPQAEVVEPTPETPAKKVERVLLPPAFPGAPVEGVPARPPESEPFYRKPAAIEIPIRVDDRVAMKVAAIRAIAAHPDFYKIGNKLYDIIVDDELDAKGNEKKPIVRQTIYPHLYNILGSAAVWFKDTHSRDGVPHRTLYVPPRDVVAGVLAAGAYPGVRELRGIITVPIFRKDGTLITRPGYDPASGLLYRPEKHIRPVSADPCRAELAKALSDLRYVLRDFPFVDRDIAFSVWLSAIFEKFMRNVFESMKPVRLVAANKSGGGKTKVVNTAAIIVEGHEAPTQPYHGNDEEDERVLGSIVANGDEEPIVSLDNIKRGVKLASAAFENFLTAPRFSTRSIGTSKRIKAVWHDVQLWATGNDLETASDMARRVLRIEIEDRTGYPQDRPVAEKNLEAYCKRNRAELIHAVLTLLSGFFAARARKWDITIPDFASFEGWTLVRKAIIWCGLRDPMDAAGKAEDDATARKAGYVVEHLRAMSADRKMYMGAAVQLLKQGLANPTASPHKKAADFFSNIGVDITSPKGAANSLGARLRPYKGHVHTDAAGKRWLLYLHDDSGGSFFRVDAV